MSVQRRLLPCFRWTIGEALLALLLLAAAAGTDYLYGLGVGKPGIDNSGTVPEILLALTFGTVSHNSIWTFLLGIPFERALSYHKLFAVLAVLSGAWHGFDAYHIEVSLTVVVEHW